MQYCLLTIQIMTWPEKIRISSKSIKSHFFVKLLNAKQGKECYYLSAISSGTEAETIFNSYEKGDYLIVEGNIINFITPTYSGLLLLISKEHPIFVHS
uniref:Single-stranded DNA binding protein n=1 Tax=Nemalion sp. H.1444 TaxID=1907586 RepID=A0A1G4NWB6_9FLOR|nr:Hypothetical protein ycf41 [Nemalion sp. H.1444]